MLVEDTHFEDYEEVEETIYDQLEKKEKEVNLLQERKPIRLTVVFIILIIVFISVITAIGLKKYIYTANMREPIKVGDTKGPN